MTYFIAIICVFGIAAGQLLFKLSAVALHKSENIFDQKLLITLFSAFALYGVTTIAWVWVLQKIELGKAYPLMALAFVLVPIGSYFIFGERFQPQYFVGVTLIFLGIIVTLHSS